jgi:HPt (histidine-containing phosphotransfer) domain-containing protein
MFVPDEMKLRYFERRKRDLDECVQHLKAGDLSFIEKVGHQLKGNAVTFGYPELADIGKDLEEAAREGDLRIATQAVDKFSEWVNTQIS